MDEQSHTIVRLAVHLPLEQPVYFKPGSEEEALLKAESSDSTLLAWFKLNQVDTQAHQHLYHDIPNYYTFSNKQWLKRQREGKKVIGRMYLCSPSDAERYYLRLLLLHVKGAKSYAELLTHNGVMYPSFKESAKARMLLEDDAEWEKCIEEAILLKMPAALRTLYASICVLSNPSDTVALFDKYRYHLIEDFLIKFNDEQTTINLSLIEMQKYFRIHGKKCSDFGLADPMNFDYYNYDETVNYEDEKIIGVQLYKSLNTDQLNVVDTIMDRVKNYDCFKKNAFFIDGPGTLFYKKIL